MSAQISRSGKTLNRRHAEGCNDSMAGRARSAIINAQLETGACRLMERQQQRLAAPRTRRSQLVRYLRFVSHADAPNCASRSAPKTAFTLSCTVAWRFLFSSQRRPIPKGADRPCRPTALDLARDGATDLSWISGADLFQAQPMGRFAIAPIRTAGQWAGSSPR